MGGFISSLRSASEAMRAFEKALQVIGNNVTNASTPGYARQVLPLQAAPFSPERGLTGGVQAGEPQSTRNEFADALVRRRAQSFGLADEKAAQLAQLEPIFDISDDTGIPAALSRLFQSFTAWSVTPNDTVARGLVIDRAADAARRLNEASQALAEAAAQTADQVRDTVTKINSLAKTVRDLNVSFGEDIRNRNEPSLDAKLTSTLEELSEYVDITALREPDGRVTVIAGGQIPLVIGNQQFELAADFSSGQAIFRDGGGRDISSEIGGRLGGLIEVNNNIIPSLSSDLNRLAAGLADRVNGILAEGADPTDPTRPGAPLFTYDADAGAAATLAVSDAIGPDLLAAGTPGAPAGNAIALKLANLQTSKEIDSTSFLAFYGSLAQRVGDELNAARGDQNLEQRLLEQARSLRDQSSGVSLDQEAEQLLEYQRAYQASARIVAVLNELTDTVLNMIP